MHILSWHGWWRDTLTKHTLPVNRSFLITVWAVLIRLWNVSVEDGCQHLEDPHYCQQLLCLAQPVCVVRRWHFGDLDRGNGGPAELREPDITVPHVRTEKSRNIRQALAAFLHSGAKCWQFTLHQNMAVISLQSPVCRVILWIDVMVRNCVWLLSAFREYESDSSLRDILYLEQLDLWCPVNKEQDVSQLSRIMVFRKRKKIIIIIIIMINYIIIVINDPM